MMNIPTLKDYPLLSASGENISNESHIIPGSSPYRIALHQWPVVTTDTITSQADNVWDDLATAQSLITVTVGGNPRTLVATTPSSGQVQLQLADQQYRYSPYLTFHSSDAGGTALVSYTGLGSVVLARYLDTLFTQIQRLESFPYLRIVSLGTYNSGNYDGNGTNGKGVYVNPSGFALEFDGTAYTWNGGSYDLSSLTAFSTASYWKRLGIYLIVSGGVLGLTVTESAEASAQVGLSNPDAPAATALLLGFVDVHDDGSSTTGSIQVLTESAITSQVTLLTAGPVEVPTYFDGSVTL